MRNPPIGLGLLRPGFDLSTACQVASRFRVGRARPARIHGFPHTSIPMAASPNNTPADAGRRKSRNAGPRQAGCSARPPACRRACREWDSRWTVRCNMRRSLRGKHVRNSVSTVEQRRWAALERRHDEGQPGIVPLPGSPGLVNASSCGQRTEPIEPIRRPHDWRNQAGFSSTAGASTFRGRPPRAPLARAASAFTALRLAPPARPSRFAMKVREPITSASNAGT